MTYYFLLTIVDEEANTNSTSMEPTMKFEEVRHLLYTPVSLANHNNFAS